MAFQQDRNFIELDEIKRIHARFRITFLLMGALTLVLLAHLGLKTLSPVSPSSADLVAVILFALACFALYLAQISILRQISVELAEKLEAFALFDEVTKVYSYRYLDHRLTEEITRADRGEQTLAVIYVDVDNFKEVNDRFGHMVGNEILTEIGHILKTSGRASDIIGRMGGDEFFTILPETTAAEAMAVAERMRDHIRYREFLAKGGQLVDFLTFSIGIAAYPHHATEKNELIGVADEAMYRAKRSGGDRIYLWRRPAPSRVPPK